MKQLVIIYGAWAAPAGALFGLAELLLWLLKRSTMDLGAGLIIAGVISAIFGIAILIIPSVVVYRLLMKNKIASAKMIAILLPLATIITLLAGDFPASVSSIYNFYPKPLYLEWIRYLAFAIIPVYVPFLAMMIDKLIAH